MQKGYKYRIYPDAVQQVYLDRTFGCARKVWNTMLGTSIDAYNQWVASNANRTSLLN